MLPLFKIVKRELSEILSAFEFIDRTAYDLAIKHGQGRALNDGDVAGAQCFVLIETSGGRRDHDEEVLFIASFPTLRKTDERTETQSSPGDPIGS